MQMLGAEGMCSQLWCVCAFSLPKALHCLHPALKNLQSPVHLQSYKMSARTPLKQQFSSSLQDKYRTAIAHLLFPS